MCDDRLEIRAQCKCRVAARTNDDKTRFSLQRARRGNDFGYDADVLRLVDSDGRESDDGRDGAEVNGLLFAGQDTLAAEAEAWVVIPIQDVHREYERSTSVGDGMCWSSAIPSTS